MAEEATQQTAAQETAAEAQQDATTTQAQDATQEQQKEGTTQEAQPEGEQKAPAQAAPPPEEARRDRVARAVEAVKAGWRQKKDARAAERRAAEERDRAVAQASQLAAQNRQMQEVLQRLRQDPLRALEERGATPDAVNQRLVEEASPEGKIARLERELREFQRKQAEREERDRQAAQQQAQARTREETTQAYLRLVSDDKKYPALSRQAKEMPSALIAATLDVARTLYQRTGLRYTDAEIADYLESFYGGAPAGATQGTTGSARGRESERNGHERTGQEGTTRAGGTRTMSADHAAIRARLPKNFDDLPDAEQNRLLAQQLEQFTSRG